MLGCRRPWGAPHSRVLDCREPLAFHCRACSCRGCNHDAQIAAMYASCHRPEGGDSGIPPLIGLGEAGLAHALIAYKSGERPAASCMRSLCR